MRLLSIPLVLASLFMQGGGQPINIPISASWRCSADSGTHGTNGVYAAYQGECTQDLGKGPAAIQEYKPGYTTIGFYTLTYTVVNDFGPYPGWYDVEIDFGTQKFCEDYGWATEKLTQITKTCPSPGYLIVDQALPSGGPVQGQHNFVIHYSVPQGWRVSSDNYSLTFTPQ